MTLKEYNRQCDIYILMMKMQTTQKDYEKIRSDYLMFTGMLVKYHQGWVVPGYPVWIADEEQRKEALYKLI